MAGAVSGLNVMLRGSRELASPTGVAASAVIYRLAGAVVHHHAKPAARNAVRSGDRGRRQIGRPSVKGGDARGGSIGHRKRRDRSHGRSSQMMKEKRMWPAQHGAGSGAAPRGVYLVGDGGIGVPAVQEIVRACSKETDDRVISADRPAQITIRLCSGPPGDDRGSSRGEAGRGGGGNAQVYATCSSSASSCRSRGRRAESGAEEAQPEPAA